MRFDPRTSRTAVRHATARPLRPEYIVIPEQYRHLGNKYEYIVNLHGAEAYRGGLRHSLLEMEEPVGHRYDAIVPGYNAMHICFLLSFNC